MRRAMPAAPAASPRDETTPTRARHWVVFFAVTLALISYTDRVVIAQAAGHIQQDLGLIADPDGLGLLHLFLRVHVVRDSRADGWATDGAPRSSCCGWSLSGRSSPPPPAGPGATLSMLVCRFLFGVGEAGVLPQPRQGLHALAAGRRARAGPGPHVVRGSLGRRRHPVPSWPCSFEHVSWRHGFRDVRRPRSRLGSLLLLLVSRRSERPSGGERGGAGSHPARGRRYRPDAREPTPWRDILGNRSVLLLWLQYFLLSYGWWFYIQWLPTYLKEARGFALQKDAVHGRPPRGPAPLPRRHRLLAQRLAAAAARPPLRGHGARAQGPGLLRPRPARGSFLLFHSAREPVLGHVGHGLGRALPTTSRSPSRGPPAWTWAESTPAPWRAA